MKTNKIFDLNKYICVGSFSENQKEDLISKYESLGYEVCFDLDGDMCIQFPDND